VILALDRHNRAPDFLKRVEIDRIDQNLLKWDWEVCDSSHTSYSLQRLNFYWSVSVRFLMESLRNAKISIEEIVKILGCGYRGEESIGLDSVKE
jgi:hypothetical protein